MNNNNDNKEQDKNTVPFLPITESLILDSLKRLEADIKETRTELREDIKEVREGVRKDFRWVVGILIALLAGAIGKLLS